MRRYPIPNINIPDYWDDVYLEGEQYGKSDRFKFQCLAQHVINGTKVVDLGCGSGKLLLIIQKKKPKCELWGVDFSEQAIGICESQGKDIRFSVGDVTRTGLASGYYDYAFASEVLEHLEKPVELIKEANRLLKKGGILILTTPYKDRIPSGQHIWEFDYSDIEAMCFKWFSKYWVFPYASGRGTYWCADNTPQYPSGNMDVILAIAIK